MTMEKGRRRWRTASVAAALVIFLGTVAPSLCSSRSLENHRTVIDPEERNVTALLRVEARLDDDALDLNIHEAPGANKSQHQKGDDRQGYPVIPALAEDRSRKTVESSTRDSYLDALKHSHTSKDPNEGVVRVDAKPKVFKISRREYVHGPVYRPEIDSGQGYKDYSPPRRPTQSYGPPSASYGAPNPTQVPFLPTPSDSYSLPAQSWDNFNPQSTYGNSQQQNSYEAPSPFTTGNSYESTAPHQHPYSPPSNSYLPPAVPQQGYGPPAPVYGAPYALSGLPQLPSFPAFAWPFALKLNAFTIAKIILKLVIFKMIVKFIAIICLLLFIPKLEDTKKGEMDEDEGRGFFTANSMSKRLSTLASVVVGSIEKHENRYGKLQTDMNEDCSSSPLSFGCRLKKTLAHGESWSDYSRLLENYAHAEGEMMDARDHRIEESNTNFVST